ncbi:MAG: putative toxin-antitoxin system toxin component, PIN family [Candidatus Korobacteraceae bacterium]
MTRIVLDTNVLVSALLNSRGVPAQVLLLSISEPDIQLCVSGDVFAEYEEVLARPLLRRSEGEIEGVLRAIREKSLWISPRETVHACSDPDDNIFLACAQAAEAHYVVTGNVKHFPTAWDQHPHRNGSSVSRPRRVKGQTLLKMTPIFVILTSFVIGSHATAQSASSAAKLAHCSGDARGKPPQYPESLRGSGIQGTVIVEAVVDGRGCAESVTVVQKLNPALDQLAKQMVSSWKFKAAMKDGKPVTVKAQIPIEFHDPGGQPH